MGRKPLPRELKELRGTLQPCRDRPSSTIGDPILLNEVYEKCQVSGLRGATERARYIYWALVKKVAAQKMLDVSFCQELLFYAIEYDHFITCCEDIKTKGIYLKVESKKGTFMVPNPAVKQRDKALEILLKIGGNFGFSPVDRQRLKIPVEDPKDKKLKAMFAMVYEDNEDSPDVQ